MIVDAQLDPRIEIDAKISSQNVAEYLHLWMMGSSSVARPWTTRAF